MVQVISDVTHVVTHVVTHPVEAGNAVVAQARSLGGRTVTLLGRANDLMDAGVKGADKLFQMMAAALKMVRIAGLFASKEMEAALSQFRSVMPVVRLAGHVDGWVNGRESARYTDFMQKVAFTVADTIASVKLLDKLDLVDKSRFGAIAARIPLIGSQLVAIGANEIQRSCALFGFGWMVIDNAGKLLREEVVNAAGARKAFAGAVAGGCKLFTILHGDLHDSMTYAAAEFAGGWFGGERLI